MSDFTDVRVVRIHRSVIDQAQEFLRRVGETGREGMVLWIGRRQDDEFLVTGAIVPDQKGLRTRDGVCVVVNDKEMHRINMHLFNSKLQLIAQVHTHPGEAYHSETDDEFAIATTAGCLSLVIPNFAERDFDLESTAVYRLSKKGVWDEVPPSKVKKLISIETTQ